MISLRQFKRVFMVIFCLFLLISGGMNAQASELDDEEISGMVGITPAEANSCIAIWVPVEKDSAISRIKWYNNDALDAFPEILVQSGTADYPVALAGANVLAESVSGGSLAWSEVSFSEPVACSSTGLYVIFRIPEGTVSEAEGYGGGPALGYTTAEDGYPGWISADGVDWVKIHPAYGFAIRPVFVPRDPSMLQKSMAKPDEGLSTQALRVTALYPAAPNPFNPQTTLKYSLREAGMVDLAIYNIKGELVKRLVSGQVGAGEHEAIWNGRDRRGASLASGVYFARFVSAKMTMTQRLVLLQ